MVSSIICDPWWHVVAKIVLLKPYCRESRLKVCYNQGWPFHAGAPLLMTVRSATACRSGLMSTEVTLCHGRERGTVWGLARYTRHQLLRDCYSNQFTDTHCLQRCILTLSSPVVSNGYTTKCSKPYWSNPPFLFFFDIRALWRSVLSARVPERQKNKNGGLDQHGFEHFVV